MKRTIITVIITLALTAFAIHAVEQTAFSGAGIIESTTGGFKFPDGTVQLSAASSAAATQCGLADEYVIGFDSSGQIVCQSLFHTEIETTHIESMPYSIVDNTSLGTEDNFVYYSCAQSVLNSEPEIVFDLYTTAFGSLTINLAETAGTDNNIYLLSSPKADGCVASSGGGSLTYNVNVGEHYWIVIDPFCNGSGECFPGSFELNVDLVEP